MIMNKKHLIILFIFTSLILTITVVSAAENNTNTTSSMDTEIITSDTPTYATLYEEINNASENSELILTKDYTYDTDNDYSALKHENYIIINKTIIINGNGHTINGSGEGSGFVIEEGVKKVILKNIKFVNCYNNKNNHRILDIKGDTIIENCTFIKCGGYDLTPGVITITGDNNIIKDCIFRNCLNAMIYPQLVISEPLNGGIIYVNGEYNKITNCNFTDYYTNYQFSNSNTYKIRGNVIYIEMSYNIIEKCNLKHISIIKQSKTNIVKYGDIYIHTGKNNITQCTFDTSESSNYGTFIFSNASTINIKECKFIKSGSTGLYIRGDNSTLSNSQFISCTGYATKWTGSNGVMSNCTYTNCDFNNEVNYWTGSNGQYIDQNTVPETQNNTSQGKENNTNTTNSTDPVKNNNATSIQTKTTINTNSNINVVKKITPKIIAKKKTYKAKTKNKKYTVKLTVNNKPLKKATLTLKLKGKTYTAKTNTKGIATFKLKISKKGKHTGTISFKSTKKYNSKKIKTSIIIK